MEDMYTLFPELNHIIRKISMNLNVSYSDYYHNTTLTSNLHRLEWFMTRYPDLILKVPDIYVASFLDILLEEFKKLIPA